MAAPDSNIEDGSEGTTSETAMRAGAENGTADRDASWPRLQRQIFRTASHHLPAPSDAEAASVDPPPERTGSYARWLPVLKGLPWVLGALFALSFVWDFPGVRLTVGGYTVVLENLLRFTAVSGLVGFGTNWLAITMLFRPREARPVVGQGLVPAQRERVAYRLAQAVSDELINKALIKEKIRESGLVARYRDVLVAATSDVATDDAVRTEGKALLRRVLRDVLSTPSVQKRVVALTAEQVEAQAGEGLSGLMLRAYRYFGEDDFRARLRETVQRLPDAVAPLVEELDPMLDRLPAELERRGDEIEALLTRVVLRLVDTIDLERMIYENVRAYDEQQLEMLLRRTTNEQLNYIKYLGAALGIVGGFIIWAPAAALAVFTVLGLAVYGVDEALYRARTDRAPSS